MKNEFPTASAAKEFLVGKVAAQAAVENVAFTDDERKLMYYSVNDISSQDSTRDESDDPQFEAKISGLVERAYKNDSEKSRYKAAFKKLSEGDHYLSVLSPFRRHSETGDSSAELYQNPLFWSGRGLPFVFIPGFKSTPWRKSGSLFLTALALAGGMFLVTAYWQPVKESFWHWLHK